MEPHLSGSDYLELIRQSDVYGVAVRSPLDPAPVISRRLGAEVFLKREDLQPVHSFKLRGAHAAMSRLDPELRGKGVVAASAGNHAQGVALAAQKMGCRAVIVVPATTPDVKREAIVRLGAELVTHGDTYNDAYLRAREIEQEESLTFIHPYDDPFVIAGQGTIGLELDEQLPAGPLVVFAAVGGGGLVSGLCLAVKQLRPGSLVFGVEPEDSPAMHDSLASGRRVELEKPGLFADGVAVRQVGVETFRLCQELLDGVILVSNDSICAAIKDVYEENRSILEPSGALPIAGIKQWLETHSADGRPIVAITGGANVSFDRLRHISERADLGEHAEAIFAVRIPERPGSFKQLCSVLGRRSVTEFNYRLSDAAEAVVFVGVKTSTGEEAKEILHSLVDARYPSIDLTDDELAKTHVRHMIGGMASVSDENVYHFIFPERPGALSEFLDRLGGRWNISLFHYRNHGSDRGRVLVGFQVPVATRSQFNEFLKELGYEYTEESLSPSVGLFLSRPLGRGA